MAGRSHPGRQFPNIQSSGRLGRLPERFRSLFPDGQNNSNVVFRSGRRKLSLSNYTLVRTASPPEMATEELFAVPLDFRRLPLMAGRSIETDNDPLAACFYRRSLCSHRFAFSRRSFSVSADTLTYTLTGKRTHFQTDTCECGVPSSQLHPTTHRIHAYVGTLTVTRFTDVRKHGIKLAVFSRFCTAIHTAAPCYTHLLSYVRDSLGKLHF